MTDDYRLFSMFKRDLSKYIFSQAQKQINYSPQQVVRCIFVVIFEAHGTPKKGLRR